MDFRRHLEFSSKHYQTTLTMNSLLYYPNYRNQVGLQVLEYTW
jgi:hypothetical protein